MKRDAARAIESLIHSVAESAAQSKVKLSERIEALRVLAPYYTALKKHNPAPVDDEADKITINGLQDAVRRLEDGNGQAVSDYK